MYTVFVICIHWDVIVVVQLTMWDLIEWVSHKIHVYSFQSKPLYSFAVNSWKFWSCLSKYTCHEIVFFRKTTQFQCQRNQMNLQFIVTLFLRSSFRRYKPPHHPHNCKLRKCIDQRANDPSLQDTAYMMTFCMKAWRTGKEDLLRKDLGFIYNFPGQVVYG